MTFVVSCLRTALLQLALVVAVALSLPLQPLLLHPPPLPVCLLLLDPLPLQPLLLPLVLQLPLSLPFSLPLPLPLCFLLPLPHQFFLRPCPVDSDTVRHLHFTRWHICPTARLLGKPFSHSVINTQILSVARYLFIQLRLGHMPFR